MGYSGANIEGKHRQFIVHLGGPEYFSYIRQMAENGYEGFTLGEAAGAQANTELSSAG